MTRSISTILRRRNVVFHIILFTSLLARNYSLAPAFSEQRPKQPAGPFGKETFEITQHDHVADQAVQSFLGEISSSIHNKTFISFTFRGASKKDVKDFEQDQIRGILRLLTGRLVTVQNGNTKLQVTYKYYLATDIVKNWDLQSAQQELTTLLYSMASPNIKGPQHDASSEWGIEALQHAPGTTLGLQSATLETTIAIYELNFLKSKLSRKGTKSSLAVKPETHDRPKEVPLPSQSDFFQALGVTNVQGKPRTNMSSKLRQCQKFVEIVSKLVPQKDNLSVVDMGCGRGYLTFALHSYLYAQNRSITSCGIDVRPKLVNEINAIARSLGDPFANLHFEQGTIEEFLSKSEPNNVDVLIALHACDTATDDAIWSGISKNASVIVVAPCCHKEVRPQLNRFASRNPEHPLADVWRHNIYRERLAESVTDSLRALLLEMAGYQVQVFEFIGGEHTSKNVMITATRHTRRFDNDEVRSRIKALCDFHGVHEQKLASLLGITLQNRQTFTALSARSMPPM